MYSAENLETVNREYDNLLREYYKLTVSITVQGQALSNDHAKEQILHGVSRRIFVLRRAVENIFSLFPPNTTRPLSTDTLYDVQINLHAFTMNLYGVFENCAWAFVIFHNLKETIGSRLNISLFKEQTKRYLPEPLKAYFNLQNTKDWHEYLKSYRDSLAHRIPLYVPPANFTTEEAEKHGRLQEEQMECFRRLTDELTDGNIRLALVERVEQICVELENMGSPSPFFLHSLTEDDDIKPILIHPQLISDSRAIIEFVNLFLQEWQTIR